MENTNINLNLKENENNEDLIIDNKEQFIEYYTKITTPSNRIANIISNTISVDKEFSNEVIRKLYAENNVLVISYRFKSYMTKSFKKSLSSLFDNIELILNTIEIFDK